MRKLTVKTFTLLTVLSLAIITIIFLYIWTALPQAGRKSSQHMLAVETEQLVSALRNTKKQNSEPLFTDFIRKTGAYLFLLDREENAVNLYTFEKTNMSVESGDGHPFRFADSDEEYILVVQYNGFHSDELKRAIAGSIPFAVSAALILCFAGAWFFSKYTTQPIIRISNIAEKMANLDFSWYCPDMRGDEIGMLSSHINELSDKLHAALNELNLRNCTLRDEIALEKMREQQRMLFFSGVSHELKTPIAIVIGQLEGMQAGIGVYKDREKYLARSAEILRSLCGFIKEVLEVSHLDMPDSTEYEEVNISEEIKELIDEYSDYAKDTAITVSAELQDHIIVSGNEKLLAKAFGNIIGNAVTHTHGGGHVTIKLTKKDGVSLIVENSPAHIDETHLPHVFEAFYSADTAAGHGSGLGLYITRIIFENYNVGYKIENVDDKVRFTANFDSST